MDNFQTLDGRRDIPESTPSGVGIYEYCHHIPVQPYRPEVVDCEIHLEYIEYPGKRTVKKLVIKITCDEAMARWCAEHPTYNRGTFPFVAYVLHDWMMRRKFIPMESDVIQEFEGGVEDFNTGGKMFFSLECKDEEDGTWLVPLADIARKHLMDQAKVFYRNNPWAMSSRERMVTVMEEQKKKKQRQLRAKRITQKIDRKRVIRPRNKHTLFVDESGDIGFKNVGDSYVFTGVLIPNILIEEVNQCLRDIIARNWLVGGQTKAPSELHLNQIPASKHESVTRDLSELFSRLNLTAISFVMQKQYFAYYLMRRNIEARALQEREEDPFNIRWNHLLSGNYFIRANTLATSVELLVAQLFNDYFFNGKHIEILHDKKRDKWMNVALKIGFKRGVQAAKIISKDRFGETLEPGLVFSTAHSEHAPGLWLADWISNEVFGWTKGADFSPAFTDIKSKCEFIGFLPSGEMATGAYPGGVAERIYPDSPRLLEEGDPSVQLKL